MTVSLTDSVRTSATAKDWSSSLFCSVNAWVEPSEKVRVTPLFFPFWPEEQKARHQEQAAQVDAGRNAESGELTAEQGESDDREEVIIWTHVCPVGRLMHRAGQRGRCMVIDTTSGTGQNTRTAVSADAISAGTPRVVDVACAEVDVAIPDVAIP